MRNFGPRSTRWLAEIDIRDIEDIRALGAVECYARLRFRFGRHITRNMLFALEAAIRDMDWRALTPQDKAALDAAAKRRLEQFPT